MEWVGVMNRHSYDSKRALLAASVCRPRLENWVFASPAQERLKLIDFGLATAYIAGKDDKGALRPDACHAWNRLDHYPIDEVPGRTQKLNQMCGTCYYVAPAACWHRTVQSVDTQSLCAHNVEAFQPVQRGTAKEVIGLKDGAICKGDGYGQEVDIWALGVLVYMLVSGMPPFNGKSHADVIWMLILRQKSVFFFPQAAADSFSSG